ncbi:MAG: glycosyltransferase family 4 protein, partial [Gammaproteobacteria bacterium]|nr:glycosyltransferase family 4 protein [Gammaproteobacteria bacterium]
MPTKRLWIINQYATPPNLPGITRHYSLGKHLVSRGWEVTVFTSNFRHETKEYFFPRLDRPSYMEVYDGVKFVFVNQKITYNSNSLDRIRNILEFGRRVREVLKQEGLRQRPDMLLGSSFHFLNAEVAFWAAQRFQAVPVLEVRDLWPEALVYLRGLSERHPVVQLLAAWSRRLYRQGKGVVVLSRAIEKKIQSYFPNKPTLFLPNPVDLDLFSAESFREWDDLEPIKAMRKSAMQTRLLYIGTVGEANAFDTIWEAARQLKGEKVAFFVVGHGEKFETYKKRAEEEGLNMQFFRPVPKRAVPALLNEADGLV